MKTFKQKAVYAALASATVLLSAGAGAVNINHDGLGEALIYPYYTVRNSNNTFISVVNTTNAPKAVKVRFLEGKNTTEVLDFNLWLSAYDVWTGAIVASGDGAGITTADKSCTNPKITGVVPFRNSGLVADSTAAALQGLDRTREGYIEMIEMASVINGTPTQRDVTHGGSGVPTCALVSNSAVSSNIGDYGLPTGGMFGAGTIVGSSMSNGFNATAIEGMGYVSGVTSSGTTNPNLGSGTNLSAVVVDSPSSGTSRITAATFAGAGAARNAVSATIMHKKVMGEYAYTTDGFSTDWVITFPTKRSYVNNGSSTATAPFQNVWSPTQGRACVDVVLSSYDREEGSSTTADDFSPTTTSTPALCWESTVISFGGLTGASASRVLGSTNAVGYNAYQKASPAVVGQEGGWATLEFGSGSYNPQLTSASGSTVLVTGSTIGAPVAGAVTFNGLPTIGFAVSEFRAPAAVGNFNTGYQLNFTRSITAGP